MISERHRRPILTEASNLLLINGASFLGHHLGRAFVRESMLSLPMINIIDAMHTLTQYSWEDLQRGKALWKRGVDIIKEDVSDGNYIECLIRSADYTHIFVFEDNIHANIEEIRSFHKVILDSIKDIRNITILPVISKTPNILTTMDITHDIKLRLLSNMYERYSKDHQIRTIMVNIESIVIGDGLDSESGVMNILDQLQNDSAVQIEQQLGSAVEERFQTLCTGDDRIDRELCNKITKVSHVADVIKHITDELANPIHDDWFNAIIIDMGEDVSISEFVDSLKSALDGFSYLKCMKGYEDAKDLKLPLEIVTHQHSK